MDFLKYVRITLVAFAVAGVCVPQMVFAVAPSPAPAVIDVALRDGGVLHGQVVNVEGSGVAGMPVSIKAQDRTVAATTTAPNGTFSIPGLKGGVYQVATVQGQGVYRLWSPGTAPPIAQQGAVVYARDRAVDGNLVAYTQGGGGLKMLLANPIVIAGVIATAVAVPVALANSHDASP